ncbi:MAG TPA: type II secretion system protein [Tepidisphaeraceae bacterium]|nr:type II secretion system protein [Tepidisphaeraceae bacterium]
MSRLPSPGAPRRLGFTLVELLVVIGIIAILVAILLPALQSARKQAAAVKCAAQMREIGTAFQMYSMENKGWWPVGVRQSSGADPYSLYDHVFTNSFGPYWFNFLSKYVTKTKQGVASGTASDAVDSRNTVLWGCPEWTGYSSTTIGGINRVQTGFGMNIWPSFTATHPTTSFPPPRERAAIFGTGAGAVGKFYKQVQWTKPSERALVGDSRFWESSSDPCPRDPGDPSRGNFPAQPNINNSVYNTLPGQTRVDVYRHGKYPRLSSTNSQTFEKTGGKVGYNVLFCDGHVAMANDQRMAYEAWRMRFPG